MRARNKWLAGHLWAQVLLSIGLATAVILVVLFGTVTVLVGVSSDVRTTVGLAVSALVFLVWLTWYGFRQRGVPGEVARALGDDSGPDPAHW